MYLTDLLKMIIDIGQIVIFAGVFFILIKALFMQKKRSNKRNDGLSNE